jgi:hypothetical protein
VCLPKSLYGLRQAPATVPAKLKELEQGFKVSALISTALRAVTSCPGLCLMTFWSQHRRLRSDDWVVAELRKIFEVRDLGEPYCTWYRVQPGSGMVPSHAGQLHVRRRRSSTAWLMQSQAGADGGDTRLVPH